MSKVIIKSVEGGFVINNGLANPPHYRVSRGDKYNHVIIENVTKDNDIILGSTDIRNIEVDGELYTNIKDFSEAIVGILFLSGGGTGSSSGTGGAEILNDYEQTGTIQFTDTEYDTGNRLTILSNTPTPVPNNKGSVFNISAPDIATDWIDSNGKLTPDSGNGDDYLMRLTFKYNSSVNNRNMTLDLDIGGSQGIIHTETKRLARGAGNDYKESFVFPYYTAATFLANGGIMKLTIDGQIQVFDFVYLLQKTRKVLS